MYTRCRGKKKKKRKIITAVGVNRLDSRRPYVCYVNVPIDKREKRTLTKSVLEPGTRDVPTYSKIHFQKKFFLGRPEGLFIVFPTDITYIHVYDYKA